MRLKPQSLPLECQQSSLNATEVLSAFLSPLRQRAAALVRNCPKSWRFEQRGCLCPEVRRCNPPLEPRGCLRWPTASSIPSEPRDHPDGNREISALWRASY